MARYVALLRGVFTGTTSMASLRRAFEGLGLGDVATVLASGNVLFSARAGRSAGALERRIEHATGIRAFVEPIASLARLIESQPFARFRLARGSKQVVTFLRRAPRGMRFPIVRGGARILGVRGTVALSAYVRQPGNPVFMALLADTFGDDITTRTWGTLEKILRAARAA